MNQKSDTYRKKEKRKKGGKKKKRVRGRRREKKKNGGPTAPGVPRRSPIQVLTGPDVA